METVYGMDLNELEERIASMGFPRYRARQLFTWIHGKAVFDPGHMHNLPGELRKRLEALLPPLPVVLDEAMTSTDGTEKFRFRLRDGKVIESVRIPDGKRVTLCVSTQVGCAMGCRFCRTARMGWQRNLEAGEILGQFYALRAMRGADRPVTHLVLMGMGEPLANLEATVQALKILVHPLGCAFSPRRITVSTVGIPGALKALFGAIPVSITLSLNAGSRETRMRLMPVERRHPMAEVLQTLRALPLPPRRRFTIAYVLIRGENDSRQEARELVRALSGLRCKVNLIPFNPFPGCGFERPAEAAVLAFQDFLRGKGISTHVRWSRGEDVLAACGQLAGEIPAEGGAGASIRRSLPEGTGAGGGLDHAMADHRP